MGTIAAAGPHSSARLQAPLGLAQRREALSAAKTYLGCVVYVSEAHNRALLSQLEAIAVEARGTALANLFVDAPYNRTAFTLVGAEVPPLAVLTYGWAHPEGRQLASLRRELGYFTGAAAGIWQGSPLPAASGASAQAGGSSGTPTGDAVPLPVAPCFGPLTAPARSGVCCVGASPWIVNYNVLLHAKDMAAAAAIARAVSERGGGLPAVQAMALRHEDGIEVACNLLDPAASPPEAVLAEVQRLAAAAGLQVGRAYRTNRLPAELAAAAAAAGL
ncbi:hypothetical protein ABPG75_012644 [Micractinium tetrahymenae]